MPMVSSEKSTDVTRIVEGPIARARSADASVSSRESGDVSVRNPSSNWLGVMMSAFGTTRSRMIGGIAGSTKQPDVALPITGSHVYVAAGFAALTCSTADEDHLGDPGPALVAGQDGVALVEHAALGDAR